MVLSFHYRNGNTNLHFSHPLTKILAYLLVNFLLAFNNSASFLVICGCLLFFYLLVNPMFLTILKELRGFFWIFIIGYVSRAHLSGGVIFTILPDSLGLTISWNESGAIRSAFFILQVSSAILITDLLMSTTKISDLQRGIYLLLAFINRQWAWKISIMFRIMLVSIPLLMDEANLSSLRLSARGLRRRRKPLRYLRAMGITMIKTVNYMSNVYFRALIARGWNGSVQHEYIKLGSSDVQIILLVSLLFMFKILSGLL